MVRLVWDGLLRGKGVWTTVGSQGPWVSEVLSECGLSTWVLRMSRTIAKHMQRLQSFIPRWGSKEWQSLPWGPMCRWYCVQKMSTKAFSPRYLRSAGRSPTETAPTEISPTCCLDPAEYHKPLLLSLCGIVWHMADCQDKSRRRVQRPAHEKFSHNPFKIGSTNSITEIRNRKLDWWNRN